MLGGRPVTDNAALGRVHGNTRRRNNKTEVLYRISMKSTLLGFGVEMVLLEML